jgi:hypothetical protein
MASGVAVDSTLRLHPDRLLPPAPAERSIARRLYDAVRDKPVILPHGHVDPRARRIVVLRAELDALLHHLSRSRGH